MNPKAAIFFVLLMNNYPWRLPVLDGILQPTFSFRSVWYNVSVRQVEVLFVELISIYTGSWTEIVGSKKRETFQTDRTWICFWLVDYRKVSKWPQILNWASASGLKRESISKSKTSYWTPEILQSSEKMEWRSSWQSVPILTQMKLYGP